MAISPKTTSAVHNLNQSLVKSGFKSARGGHEVVSLFSNEFFDKNHRNANSGGLKQCVRKTLLPKPHCSQTICLLFSTLSDEFSSTSRKLGTIQVRSYTLL